MIALLVMVCIKVNSMSFCSMMDQTELSFRKKDVDTLQELEYYPLPRATWYNAAEAIYGSRDKAPMMPPLTEGCIITVNGKEFYYQYKCQQVRSKLQ